LKKSLKKRLFLLQEEILRAGSLLAFDKELKEFRAKAKLLEKETEVLKDPNLKKFVKPGETKGAAFLHFARVVCRQVEREVVALEEKKYLPLIEFLNRLSLFLFWLGVKEEFSS
ncbi:MAG: ATP:cob(I)alamin adenosyltransferase, partial [Microgenomates group bacterium]